VLCYIAIPSVVYEKVYGLICRFAASSEDHFEGIPFLKYANQEPREAVKKVFQFNLGKILNDDSWRKLNSSCYHQIFQD
jgi:hypothetical protein